MCRSVLTLLALLSITSCSLVDAAAEQRPPNVLLILADDLGFADLGCYGSEIDTPNLDRLAANGLRYTQFYNTGRCWPTRGSILTGYYAQQIRRDKMRGIKRSGGRGKRPSWAPLLPTMLRPLGYRCYHSGKWHIDGQPLKNGFDRSYRMNDHNRFFNPKRHTLDDKPLPPVPPGTDYYTTSAIADRAIEQLRGHATKHGGEPFFQFLAFTSPHFPLQGKPEDIAKYATRYRVGWEQIRAARHRRQKALGLLDTKLSAVEPDVGPPYHFADAFVKLGPAEVNRPLPWSELTEEQREFQATKMSIHAAMIDRMDQDIGRVLTQLQRMGAFEDTLIVFLSDNGASAEIMVRGDGHDREAAPGSAKSYLCLGPGWSNACNTPFRRHKTWVHEGGIATPFIAHWPRRIHDRGAFRHTPAHVIDFVPTVLELAGGKIQRGAPGRSLVDTFARDVTLDRPALWWSHDGHRALRLGDWKLVAAKGAAWELFDLSRDRAETHDLAATQPARVQSMARLWQAREDAFRAALLPKKRKQAKK